MNPFRASQKTQDFKGQHPYLSEPTSGVCLQNTYDYSPFGVSLDGRTMEDGFYRRGFNGMEKDDEVKGAGNSYTTEFRQLDPRVGRWLIVDPLSVKYSSMSPYNAFINNPILIIDTGGDSVARFGCFTGNFLGFYDDGKSTWSFQRGYYDSENNGKWKTKSKGLFNEAKVDVQAIKNGKITRIEIMSDQKVEKQINRSGVKNVQDSELSFAKEQGAKKMDYGIQGILSGDLSANTFYVREGITYNLGDIGNYLWGRGMAELGIDLRTSKLGAHWNNFANGRSQKISYYDFGPGTYGSAGILDSQGDQNAIHRGYSNSPAGKKIIQQENAEAEDAIRSLDIEVHMVKF